MIKNVINDVVIETISVKIGKSEHFENTYLVYDAKKKVGVIIDPGDKKDTIVDKINNDDIKIKAIFLTHTHADHFGALEALQKLYDVNVYVHQNDIDGFSDEEKNCLKYIDVKKQNIDMSKVVAIKDGFNLNISNLNFEFIHTPGHTDGSMCIYEKTSNVLFTGDTIFAKCYGRTDLKSGSFDDMKNSLNKIFSKFSNILIYPGHDKSSSLYQAKRRIDLLVEYRQRRES